MMKKALLLLMLFASSGLAYSQSMVEVTDQTIRLTDEENLYYGFTVGDEIELYVKELNGKELRELEVVLYPNKVIYSNFKVSDVSKTIRITEEGIYQFRFKHAGMGNRLCQVKIQRRFSEHTRNFNTTVEWQEKIDTIFKISTDKVTIGYEEKLIERTRKVVASKETKVEKILTTTERVHSSLNSSGNTSWVPFTIPENVYEPNVLFPYKAKEVVSWAYSISVGDIGKIWYEDANNRALANDATQTLVSSGLLSGGYGALAMVAISGLDLFSSPPEGENVKFELLTSIDGSNSKITYGNTVGTYRKFNDYLSGNYALSLVNDNMIDAINVEINIIAVYVITTYKDESYIEKKQVPIKEDQVIKSIKDISVKRVPILRMH